MNAVGFCLCIALCGQHDLSEAPAIITTTQIVSPAGAGAGAQQVVPDSKPVVISDDPQLYQSSMQLSSEAICWYYNTDGSCVQCSFGMCGVHCKDLNAASILFDTPYGKAERGGGWPSRTASYCDKRGIKAWNVTGWPTTREWAIWCTQTGRFAAIGYFGSHFQTLYAYDPKHETNGKSTPWGIMNNWSRSNAKIDWYSEDDFKRQHLNSGPWIVVLERPCSDNPQIVKWWE